MKAIVFLCLLAVALAAASDFRGFANILAKKLATQAQPKARRQRQSQESDFKFDKCSACKLGCSFVKSDKKQMCEMGCALLACKNESSSDFGFLAGMVAKKLLAKGISKLTSKKSKQRQESDFKFDKCSACKLGCSFVKSDKKQMCEMGCALLACKNESSSDFGFLAGMVAKKLLAKGISKLASKKSKQRQESDFKFDKCSACKLGCSFVKSDKKQMCEMGCALLACKNESSSDFGFLAGMVAKKLLAKGISKLGSKKQRQESDFGFLAGMVAKKLLAKGISKLGSKKSKQRQESDFDKCTACKLGCGFIKSDKKQMCEMGCALLACKA